MPLASDIDWPIRLSAFNALAALVEVHGAVLPWSTIDHGFMHNGRRMLFANMSKGIFRPSGMRDAALSVKTTVPRSGLPKYDDVARDDAFVYAFQRRGPDYHDNRLLLRAIELRTPLVYFYGVEPRFYRPLWPVYAAASAESERVLLSVGPAGDIFEPGHHLADPVMRDLVRRYATVEAKRRLHQDMFRGAVLRAYATRCTVCSLARRELLDAAHIVPDHDPRGVPLVTNGLALCKLHHAAYDANLMGVRPDHLIEISPRLMAERDGPTLEHALKGFDGARIHPPRDKRHFPSPEHLELRYRNFLKAS